jgi:hypothetical protein
LICSLNFLIFLAVCLNISTVINIKILTNSNQKTQSYKFTSHIAAFLCGFDHRDAWNLHANIIWSKRSTDFKELSPCSVWYHLNLSFVFLLLTPHLGDMQFYMPHNIRMAKMPRCSVYWQNLSTFKPVYKGHSREPENVPFMCIALYLQFRSIYALFINWKNEAAFYRQWFVI